MAGVAHFDLRLHHRGGVHEYARRRQSGPHTSHRQRFAERAYFWRVKATQIVGGAVFALDSAWSVGSFTVVGLGPAPGTPSFTSPASPAQFHVREFFLINWTAVPGAHHYLLEADDEPTFSYPLTLTLDALQFGTSFRAGWGNALNAFYRIVAVSAGGVRSLPSPTLSVQITTMMTMKVMNGVM